ncbi:hypothetical protein [Streptomyces sp. NPDC056192]|uniref:hypothetical protein n=1 Tax=unclassified Streptomyces TaxID=2593676 RepID=UPI0035DA9E02
MQSPHPWRERRPRRPSRAPCTTWPPRQRQYGDGASTGENQLRLNRTDWSNFNEADDYSRTTVSSYADAAKAAVHVGGELAGASSPDDPHHLHSPPSPYDTRQRRICVDIT